MNLMIRTEHSFHEKPESPDYIIHYGVKGMRWGVRRSEEDLKASRNKKAEKYEKRAADVQKEIDKVGARKTTDKLDAQAKSDELSYLKTVKAQELKNAKDVREGRLTDKQKKVLKGAAIAGAVAVAVGTYSVIQSGEANRWMMKGEKFLKGKEIWPEKNSLSKKGMDVDEIFNSVVKPINPDYGGLGAGMNCRRCTFAYEMRRRGKDVAATKTTNAHGQTLFGLINATDPDAAPMKASGKIAALSKMATNTVRDLVSPNEKSRKVMEALGKKGLGEELISNPRAGKDIFDALSKKPDGARGELVVAWKMGGAHSIAWEIVKGTPVIFDTQTGQIYRSSSDWDTNAPGISAASITRLDNKTLNDEFLMRWLKNAK